MRLAGTVNGKTGAHARILEADLALPAYPIGQLVGDLPDPIPHDRAPRTRQHGRQPGSVQADQPARVLRAARRDRRPARRARVAARRPARGPQSRRARSGPDPSQGWRCHAGGCGARGAIYDLASVLLGGPWGRELRGEAFKRARAYVDRRVRRAARATTEPAKE